MSDTAHGMGEMTPEQRLGQLFMVGFTGLTPPPGVLDLIARQQVGGIILFSRNCRSAAQVAQLTHDLQAVAREAGHPTPLLIAVDQENGIVRRLGDAITSLPGAMALGAIDDEALTSAVAEATGQELSALGINMNLAPVADINSNPANPVIGVRSFGQDVALVARHVAAAIHGYHAAEIITSLKHFPGHGDTSDDSHVGMPSLPHGRERLERVELAPFRVGVAAGADSVMLAHLRLPALALDEQVPASLSPTIIRLAREALAYDGVLMTDCLEMGAVAKTVGVARGATLALQAGADLILISHTLDEQRAAIAQAQGEMANGALPAERVCQASERVLRLKHQRLGCERLPALVEGASVSSAAHQRLGADGYRRAVTLVRDTAGALPLRLEPAARVAVIARATASFTQASDTPYMHQALVERVQARSANARGVLIAAEAGVAEMDAALAEAQAADLIILATLNASRDARQAALIERLAASGRPIVAIAASDPYDVAAFPQFPTYLATYDYTPPALAAAVDALFGEFAPSGRLPIAVNHSS
ncbi:MAG TPA: glycoside hydrolase family 3 N-terminal domain-containing protein [Ktedonobacterales bacterium]|nr:glycoside hydrolase family 3 N-terminal domain-containing protein [Ktedonobacterales bacterium]